MNAKTLLYLARKNMKPKEIATYESNGSDLFLKVTSVSKELVKQYVFREQVKVFIDDIEHKPWYEIPFANTDWWEKRGCYCGEIEL